MCKKSPIMETSVQSKVFKNIALNVYNNKNQNNQAKSFAQINTTQLAKDSEDNAIYCPDQYVGIININKNGCVSSWNVGWAEESVSKKTKKDREKKSKEYKNKKLPVLAIVLESPHQDEFDNKNKQAVGPAVGTTGNNIEEYLPQVVFNYLPAREVDNKTCYAPEDQIPNGTYKVLLINAIQYQCSLGEDTKQYRDNVFSEMWKNVNIRKDFIDRLAFHNPKVIINCCTKGNFKDKEKEKHLRKLVQKEINEYSKYKNILKLRAAHPSSLHFGNGLSKVEEDK